MHPPSLPLRDCPIGALRALHGILTDIDDTLTRDGAITPDALDALHALRGAGIPVIAITGRPMGWSAPFAREWPVDAIVAENGAVALIPPAVGDGRQGASPGDGVRIEYAQPDTVRAANAVRLREVARRIVASVPGATLARDSAGRVTDIAVDHSEFTHLAPPAIEAVVALMRESGMKATVSSIHINGWYGDHDKPSGARWMVERLYRRRLDDELDRWLYVGDSTNDQAMFAQLPLSVGVANLLDFADRLTVWPSYITQAERGSGFAEVAWRVLGAVSGETPGGDQPRASTRAQTSGPPDPSLCRE